jgi:predicted Fe-Mo cluster-binding NifX family protein
MKLIKESPMKIAVPVKDSNLQFFGNAGHTPYFAVYTVKGSGMFRSFAYEEIRKNPRTDLDDHDHDEHHVCSHGDEDEAHVQEHFKMGEVLQDCDYLVAKRACKNTAKAMQHYGIAIRKYNGDSQTADKVLNTMSRELSA